MEGDVFSATDLRRWASTPTPPLLCLDQWPLPSPRSSRLLANETDFLWHTQEPHLVLLFLVPGAQALPKPLL